MQKTPKHKAGNNTMNTSASVLPATITLPVAVSSKAQFFDALFSATRLPLGRPDNYDALADYCRELRGLGVRRVDSAGWGLPQRDTMVICEIFRDIRLDLKLS